MDPEQALRSILSIPLARLSQYQGLVLQVIQTLTHAVASKNSTASPIVPNVSNPKRKQSTASRRPRKILSQRTDIRPLEELTNSLPTTTPSANTVHSDCQTQLQSKGSGGDSSSLILDSINKHRVDINNVLCLNAADAVGRETVWESAEPRLLDLITYDKDPKITPQKWLRNMLSQLSYARSFHEWKIQHTDSIAKFAGSLNVPQDQKELVYNAIRIGMKLINIDNHFAQIHESKVGKCLPQFQDKNISIYSASSVLLGSVNDETVRRLKRKDTDSLAQSLYDSQWNEILLNSAQWLAECIRFYEDWQQSYTTRHQRLLAQTLIQSQSEEPPSASYYNIHGDGNIACTLETYQETGIAYRPPALEIHEGTFALEAYQGNRDVNLFAPSALEAYQVNGDDNSFTPSALEAYQGNGDVNPFAPSALEAYQVNGDDNSFTPSALEAYQGVVDSELRIWGLAQG